MFCEMLRAFEQDTTVIIQLGVVLTYQIRLDSYDLAEFSSGGSRFTLRQNCSHTTDFGIAQKEKNMKSQRMAH